MRIPQANIKNMNKGRIPIQVFPVHNVYTNSFVVCACILGILHQQTTKGLVYTLGTGEIPE